MSNELTNRELNRLVAEKVMGLHVQFSNAHGGDWTGTSIETGYARVLPYSTDISAAMKVVEKMRSEGYLVFIRGKETWTVQFEGLVVANESATTLPEAICRAALAAIQGSNEK
jgi:hypothetical protein